jgi:tetratricopeptide (TPR) repeat protein
MRAIIPLIFLVVSCASDKGGSRSSPEVSKVNKDSFKKDKPLNANEVSDFYQLDSKSLNPALQDETLDRHSKEELKQLKKSADPLLQISLKCSENDFNGAFDLAGNLFHRYQKIPAYWNQIANCHLKQRSYRKALLFYNKALEISPGYVPALNNIGVLYLHQGEDQKALVAFEKAYNESRFSKTPRYNMAKIYLRYGLADMSLPIFEGLLRESPDDLELQSAVANNYVILGQYQKAFELFNRMPGHYHKTAEIGLNYVITLKRLGKKADAEKIYGQIIAPQNGSAKEYYASVGQQLGVKK